MLVISTVSEEMIDCELETNKRQSREGDSFEELIAGRRPTPEDSWVWPVNERAAEVLRVRDLEQLVGQTGLIPGTSVRWPTTEACARVSGARRKTRVLKRPSHRARNQNPPRSLHGSNMTHKLLSHNKNVM